MADNNYTQVPDERPEVRMPDERTYYVNIPIHPLTSQVADEHLHRLSLYYTIYALVFGVVGAVAIVLPLFFHFPLDQLLAWLLVAGGGVTLLQFILVCGAPGTTAFLLLGALHLGVGLWMLLQPVPNPTMLIFIIAGWFLIHVPGSAIRGWNVAPIIVSAAGAQATLHILSMKSLETKLKLPTIKIKSTSKQISTIATHYAYTILVHKRRLVNKQTISLKVVVLRGVAKDVLRTDTLFTPILGDWSSYYYAWFKILTVEMWVAIRGEFQGVLKLLMACQVRQMVTWPAVLVSGLVSVILAFVILALSSWMFKESIKLLGIFVGSDLILTSVALLLIAFMARLGHKAKETHQPLLVQSGLA